MKTNRILIRRDEGLGDVIMASSLLPAFREAHPKGEIHWQTKYDAVVQNAHLVTRVHPRTDNIFRSFDQFLDLRWTTEAVGIGLGKISFEEYANVNRIDIFAKAMGIEGAMPRFKTTQDNTAISWINRTIHEKLPAWRKKTVVMLSLFCASKHRSYDIEQAITLIDELSKEYCVILVGRNPLLMWGESMEVCQQLERLWELCVSRRESILNLLEQTTVAQLVAIMYCPDLLVTIDTGTLHIAGAQGRPQIALFGDMHPFLRIKYYQNCDHMFRRFLPCQTCENFAPFADGIVDCRRTKGEDNQELIGAPCMRGHSPEAIYKRIKENLKILK